MVRKGSGLVGGRLCLDFVNTVSWRGTDTPRDNLATYGEIVTWSLRAGAVSTRGARELRREAERRPRRADATLRRAHELRETSYRILDAWRRRRRPSVSDIARLNAFTPPRGALEWRRGTFHWSASREQRLDAPLRAVAWSTTELLIDGDPDRVKSCGSEECGWLFYDESRAARRRWCSMSDCGNRAKAKRFYARATRERLTS